MLSSDRHQISPMMVVVMPETLMPLIPCQMILMAMSKATFKNALN